MTITRYDFNHDQHPTGPLVLYADHIAALAAKDAEIAKFREALELMMRRLEEAGDERRREQLAVAIRKAKERRAVRLPPLIH